MSAVKEMEGQRFGRLVVAKRAGSDHRGKARWLCRCDCGREVIRQGPSLRRGRTVSCGCNKGEWTTDPARLKKREQARNRYWRKKQSREMMAKLATMRW